MTSIARSMLLVIACLAAGSAQDSLGQEAGAVRPASAQVPLAADSHPLAPVLQWTQQETTAIEQNVADFPGRVAPLAQLEHVVVFRVAVNGIALDQRLRGEHADRLQDLLRRGPRTSLDARLVARWIDDLRRFEKAADQPGGPAVLVTIEDLGALVHFQGGLAKDVIKEVL